MAGQRTPGATGLRSAGLASDRGVLARSPPAQPGVVAGADSLDHAADGSARHSAEAGWVRAKLPMPPDVGAPDPGLTVLVRLVPGRHAGGGYPALRLTSSDSARKLAVSLLQLPEFAPAFTDWNLVGGPLVDVVARRLLSGELAVQWRRRERIIVREPEAARPAPARAPTPVWSAPAAPSAPDYSTFPPELDAAAIAQTLVAAARDGVPFCEECRKAAQRQQGAGA